MIGSENEFSVDTGLMNIVQNDDKTFTLTLSVTPETGDTSEMEAEMAMEEDMTEEDIKALISQMCMIFKFNFPTAVTQIAGPTEGIVIDNNKLEIDIIKLGMSITENTNIVFTTSTEMTTLPVPEEMPQEESVIELVQFTDVAAEAWYSDAVNALAKGGLVAGIGDNKFNPEGTLTIAQFCQILARASNLGTGADEAGYWAAQAVKNCIDAGYVFSAGDITPENYDVAITREAAVAAMYLAKKASLTENETKLAVTEIPDFDLISEQYKENILNAYKYGITNGMDEARTFNPQGLLTRAQVCQLFYNLNWTAPSVETEAPVEAPVEGVVPAVPSDTPVVA